MHRRLPARLVATLSLLLAGCGAGASQEKGGGGSHDGSIDDGSIVTDGATDASSSEVMPLDGSAPSCATDSQNQAGCPCATAGATRACFDGPPSARHVGACKDGTQTCVQDGEFASWGACTGATLPAAESCTTNADLNCNAQLACKDPECATASACNTSCTNGATRSCYTGPAGTAGVGACRAGTQTCVGGKWSATCTGQVVPGAEDCSDAKDHNCNGLPGCLDLFACALSPACQEKCKSPLDNGCVCATGSGDTATCPEGYLGVYSGTLPPVVECCPCTANDCGNAGCCGESVCAGNSQCAGLTCNALPASCKGQVNADCDEFPEDCDEPCCKCTNCP
jgi:hypothetical protein